MDYKLLRNGSKIPCVGLGTWQINDREQMKNIISTAIDAGYQLIDTAAAYANEISLGKAILEKGVAREQIYLTDKVWNTNRGFDAVQKACRQSLKKLKTDYLDLYLIHWPASPNLHKNWKDINADTWRGMEQLCKDGLVKNIGVCNFKQHHLEELKKTAELMPLVNQYEFHVGMHDQELLDYCNKEHIVIEASSPLGNGQILNNKNLKELSFQKQISVAQICLKWCLKKRLVVIPKASATQRILENIDLFSFELTDDEMIAIDNIEYCGGLGFDSDEVTQFG